MTSQDQNELYAKINVEELLAMDEKQSSLEEMSADELLNLINEDVRTINLMEKRKSMGIASLLEAMNNQAHSPVEERLDRFVAHTLKLRSPESFSQEVHESSEIQKKVENLSMVAKLLQQQEADLVSREIECEQVTIDILASQEKLLNELDAVLERLEENDEQQPPLRRVA